MTTTSGTAEDEDAVMGTDADAAEDAAVDTAIVAHYTTPTKGETPRGRRVGSTTPLPLSKYCRTKTP